MVEILLPANSPPATVERLLRLRWPAFGHPHDIEVLDVDDNNKPDPSESTPFCGQDGANLHPIASEAVVQPPQQAVNASMWVYVPDDSESSEDENDPWPDAMLMKGDGKEGITVMDFVEQAGSYLRKHEPKFMRFFEVLYPEVVPEDIYIIDVNLSTTSDTGLYAVCLTLGPKQVFSHLWEKPEGEPTSRRVPFDVTEQDEPDPDIRARLAQQKMEESVAVWGAGVAAMTEADRVARAAERERQFREEQDGKCANQ